MLKRTWMREKNRICVVSQVFTVVDRKMFYKYRIGPIPAEITASIFRQEPVKSPLNAPDTRSTGFSKSLPLLLGSVTRL
jgi:hypothetical protein